MSAIKPTPDAIHNRAGLPQLRARSGTHASFLASLRRGLADGNRPGLAALRSRNGEDFTLGLLDAWAATLDNLSFYAERQANESYLRTTSRRRRLRALVRLIGYELAPAKAASCHLMFEVEAHDAADATLEYPPGLQVRSIPHEGELPQLFETVETLSARAEWNALRPLMAWPQILDADSAEITLTQGPPRLEPGDAVLLLQGDVPLATQEGSRKVFLRRVASVDISKDQQQIVRLRVEAPPPMGYLPVLLPFLAWPAAQRVSTTALADNLARGRWSVSALGRASISSNLNLVQMRQAIQAVDLAQPGPVRPHVLRLRAGFFGNSAATGRLKDPPVAAPAEITSTATLLGGAPYGVQYLYLDREYAAITAGSHVLIRGGALELWVEVRAVEAVGVEAYGQSARVTRLTVPTKGMAADGSQQELTGFQIRNATLWAAPEPLPLADLPIRDAVGEAVGELGADQVEIATPELMLAPGKTVAILGERADLAGVMAAEVRVIRRNEILRGHSLLTFSTPLAQRYVRDTVRISANVAEATHGETLAELLGDGDATKSFQSFRLKSAPLTHVSARNPRGMAPAIEVRVNRVLWQLVEDFRAAGPDDKVYVLRGAEDGSTSVVFGDGRQGARLPTGEGNVEALYRTGAGHAGHVEAGQLSLLVAKPVGLKAVSNPLPPAGGKDGERLADARRNAPVGVLTLGRVVTLRDYENFARGFAAIAKARADWTFVGFARPILITVAGEGGILLPESGDDIENLRAALQHAGEADMIVAVRNYRPLGFGVSARLFADPAYMPDAVQDAARAALKAAFSFDARDLGQGVSQAEVIAVLQAVAGVQGVALDALYTGDTPQLQARLVAATGRPGPADKPPVAAELLTIDPARLVLEIVQ